jgi:molybdopterin-guanine dinucleotide biosynthesis protein A
VLAGGRGVRLGGAKATAQLAGRPLAQHAIDALASVVDEVVVVAKPGTPLPPLGVPVWHDDTPDDDFHPRHGLVAALRRAQGAALLVLAVDLPHAAPALQALLAVEGATAIARAEGRLQPLCALYAPQALAILEAAPPDEALTATVARLHPVVVDVPAWSLVNVNTPQDLADAAQVGTPARCDDTSSPS